MKTKEILITVLFPLWGIGGLYAQVTQSAADAIVLARMNAESRQYTVYAKENLQTDSITTPAGELLELDYPGWIYYIRYNDQPDNTPAKRHYVVVKEGSGNLVEVNTKNALPPADLAAWRAVPIYHPNSLIDTLIGEWKLVEIMTWLPIPRHKDVIIKILSQNADSTINYEVWVKDTLFSQGSFQIKRYTNTECSAIYYRQINLKLYGHVCEYSGCGMRFINYLPTGEMSYYPFLEVFNCAAEYAYNYYQKIK